jgi:hypothetical protein
MHKISADAVIEQAVRCGNVGKKKRPPIATIVDPLQLKLDMGGGEQLTSAEHLKKKARLRDERAKQDREASVKHIHSRQTKLFF